MQRAEKIDPYKDYMRRLLRKKGLDTLTIEPLKYGKKGEETCEQVFICRKIRIISPI